MRFHSQTRLKLRPMQQDWYVSGHLQDPMPFTCTVNRPTSWSEPKRKTVWFATSYEIVMKRAFLWLNPVAGDPSNPHEVIATSWRMPEV